MLLIFIATCILWVNCASGQISSQCPSGFSELKFICYKPILGPNSFKDALQKCTLNGEELMPIQELRYFGREGVKNFLGTTTGLFRVNAIRTDTQWLEFVNAKLRPISFSNFPSFNASSGNKGDTLLFHPATPNNLYPVPFDLSMLENKYNLQPLCYKNKADSAVCDANFEECCDNGDCINGKCSCYSGWSNSNNCCCRDSTLTINLIDKKSGLKLVNRAVRVSIPNTADVVLISNGEGKVLLDGCSQKLMRASLESGFVQTSGYCKTSFAAALPLTQSQEIAVYLSQASTVLVKTISQVTFEPIPDVTVGIDGMIYKSNTKGEIMVEKCAQEPVVIALEAPKGYCGMDPFHFTPFEGQNAWTLLLKPLANVQVAIRDASTCGPLPGADLALFSTMTKENKTAISNGNGQATLADCALSKPKLYIANNGFCPSQLDLRIDSLGTSINEFVDLKPIQTLEVVVRDPKNVPIRDMTVVIGTDRSVHANITNLLGRVNFPSLCYGDAALLSVFGASFDSQFCKPIQQQVVIGSTISVTVTTDCNKV